MAGRREQQGPGRRGQQPQLQQDGTWQPQQWHVEMGADDGFAQPLRRDSVESLGCMSEDDILEGMFFNLPPPSHQVLAESASASSPASTQ